MLNQRFYKNLNIIEQMKKGQVSYEILKEYSGWGGLRGIHRAEIYQELKKLLNSEEIKSLRQTLTNAYYTPESIVRFIYAWLQGYGFRQGNILEPSAGTGVFIEYMPSSIRNDSNITMVEIDLLSSQILKKLYPDAQLNNYGFEKFQPKEKFDLIIGNPPYGSNRLWDLTHKDLSSYCIHHYFVAKSMRLLKEGGVLAMLLPAYFLDNDTHHVRHIVCREGGSLMSAYRLPDDYFMDAKVTVDIVFLVKGETQVRWEGVREIKISGFNKKISEYFYHYPNRILGNLELVDAYGKKFLSCKRLGDPEHILLDEINKMRQEKFLKYQWQILEALLKIS